MITRHHWSVAYLVALVVLLAGLNFWWTARVAHENNVAWCGLITAVNPPHAPAPTSARQKIVIRALNERARSLGC